MIHTFVVVILIFYIMTKQDPLQSAQHAASKPSIKDKFNADMLKKEQVMQKSTIKVAQPPKRTGTVKK